MNGYARFVVRLECILVVFPFLGAIYAWFAIPDTLARYNASDMAQEAFKIYISESIEWSLASIVSGVAYVVAGKMILARRKAGWNLWLTICFISLSVWFLEVAIYQQPSFLLFAKGVFWIAQLLISWLLMRKSLFEEWWNG